MDQGKYKIKSRWAFCLDFFLFLLSLILFNSIKFEIDRRDAKKEIFQWIVTIRVIACKCNVKYKGIFDYGFTIVMIEKILYTSSYVPIV